MTLPVPTAAPERALVCFALRDLAVAPENMRYGEPADDDIAQLADTILAAGVLQPLSVRPGRRREKPGMVLDGRRRLLALQHLCEAGAVAADHPVSAFVETDPGRQAAAVLLTNTAAPVHVADVIAAIGKMLKAKLTPEAIAAALGYAEVEVRRLAALAELHPKALEALKAGKITLRHARLLARLPARKDQAALADAALAGFGFQEWRVTEQLDRGQLTTADRRFTLVGPERYAAAGGRTVSDLFGERPDVLLDAEVLQSAWADQAEALAAGLAAADRVVRVEASAGPPDEALEAFGHNYGAGLDAEAIVAWRGAEADAQAAASALEAMDLATAEADAGIAAFLQAKLAALLTGEPPRPATLLQVIASGRTGLDLRAYGPAAPELEVEEPAEPTAASDPAPRAPCAPAPVAAAPAPELDGVGHALHEVRTDVATRGLIRALADDPGVALVALVARLFAVMVLRQGAGKGSGALTVQAEPYSRRGASPIEALDGDVRQRLIDRRTAWEASGQTPLAWIASLAHGEKMALLAELVALSLDLREERTSLVRRSARAEAVEIAALCQADITVHWTPDDAFLTAHPKGKLLAMLDEMGAPDSRAAGCKKDELISLVGARAAERGWAPGYLSWAAEPPDEAADDADIAADGDDAADPTSVAA